MDAITLFRQAIMAIPDWSELSGAEIAHKLKVSNKKVDLFLIRDAQIVAARSRERRRFEAQILRRVVRLARWEHRLVSSLAEELNLPESLVVRAMASSSVEAPSETPGAIDATGEPEDSPRKVLLRHFERVSQIKAIPYWELRTREYLAKTMGCLEKTIKDVFRDDLVMADERNRGQVMTREHLDTVVDWPQKTPEEIAHDLQVNTHVVKRFFWDHPGLCVTPSPLGRNSPKKRRCEMKDVPGWQTMKIKDISKVMGIAKGRLHGIILQGGETAELFRAQYRGPRSQWTHGNIAVVHAVCPTAEEAAKALNVGVSYYRERLARMGISAQPTQHKLECDFDLRLAKIPGWQQMSCEQLGKRLEMAATSVYRLFQKHRDLRSQRCHKQKWRTQSNLTERILAVPGWKNLLQKEIAQQTGIPAKTLPHLMCCVLRLAGWRRGWRIKRWNPVVEIQRIPNWKERSAQYISRKLRRPYSCVTLALLENPSLSKHWTFRK